jgi:hypothetical protein
VGEKAVFRDLCRYFLSSLSESDLSDLILQLEESPGSWPSETVQTPENTRDLHGREGPTGKLFAPDERVLTDPAQVVELRFFGGLDEAEVAQVLGVSKITVQRGWRTARAWLRSRLRTGRTPRPGPSRG